MGWAGLTLVSDTELGRLEPESTDSDAPWGATTWSSQRTEAKEDLKIRIETDFGAGAPDKVLDKWPADYAFGYTSSAFSDITSAARDDNPADVDLAGIFATAATDRIYLGSTVEFDALHVNMTATRNATASVLTARYSGATVNGVTNFTSLSATDGTAAAGATFAKSGRITWTVPSDWQRIRLNGTGDEYYWVELSISVVLTAGTSAAQLALVKAHSGLKRVTAYLALYHIYNGLAAGSPGEERWRLQAQKYLLMANDLYTKLKAKGSIWLDLNNDDVVDTTERAVSVPHVLLRG
jgi:hypothetical protein